MNQEYLQSLHTSLGITKDYNTWVIKEIFGDEIQLTDKGWLKKIQELNINGKKVKIPFR